MKTKDEVIAYIGEHGHSNAAITKITGFLIGVGLKEDKEAFQFKKGNDSWDDFSNWFYDKKVNAEEHPLLKLLSLLFELRDVAIEEKDEFMKENLDDMLNFLFDTFVIDKTKE